MRQKIIVWLRLHPMVLKIFYTLLRTFFNILSIVIPKKKKIIFSSFGGRNFDDSPYALFKEMRCNKAFKDYEFLWAFVDTNKYNVTNIKKIKIDSIRFFYELLSSKIWISNTSIDRGIGLNKKGRIAVETWHGTPLKKIGGEENRGGVLNNNLLRKKDTSTIRCAQSDYDLNIFARVFNADKSCFLLSDLPRNDDLVCFEESDVERIKQKLGIKGKKQIILYMPTYREYWIDDNSDIYMKQLVDLNKWKNKLSKKYFLLIRAHYAVSKNLSFDDDAFCINVSDYPNVNDLYKIADILISDYSSAFIDYSILRRPMFCFAPDYDEYILQRGLYLDLQKVLPCPVDTVEETLLNRLLNFDYEDYSIKAEIFRNRFVPYAGHATEKVIDEIIKKMNLI